MLRKKHHNDSVLIKSWVISLWLKVGRTEVYIVTFIKVQLRNCFSAFSPLFFYFAVAPSARCWDRNVHYVVFSGADYMEDLQALSLECDIWWQYIASQQQSRGISFSHACELCPLKWASFGAFGLDRLWDCADLMQPRPHQSRSSFGSQGGVPLSLEKADGRPLPQRWEHFH